MRSCKHNGRTGGEAGRVALAGRAGATIDAARGGDYRQSPLSADA